MSLLRTLLLPYKGSNVSLWLRRKIERLPFREILGVHLAGLTFFSAVIIPQATDLATTVEVTLETQETIVENSVPLASSYQWPLSRFGLTTRFSLGHPGIDLTAPKGTPIYPIAGGTVSGVSALSWGYGKHVVLEHERGISSLYAHLNEINVHAGQEISKATQVGTVGATGWSTGNHLHLEIYQDSTPINPLDVLPTIQK